MAPVLINVLTIFSFFNLKSFVPLLPKNRHMFPCSPKPLGDPLDSNPTWSSENFFSSSKQLSLHDFKTYKKRTILCGEDPSFAVCHGRVAECEFFFYSLKSEVRERFLLYLQDGFKALLDLEEEFLRSLQLAPSRVHNVLRNVGNFPLIITTNMDELLERFLWKTGNRGEKIRLDQVSRLLLLYFL